MPNSSNIKRRTRRSAREVRHAARSVRSSANNQAHTVLRAVNKVRSEVTGALKDGIDDLREVAAGYVEHGRDTARSVGETFEEGVQQRPLTSVLAAIGLGFLVGCFFTRR